MMKLDWLDARFAMAACLGIALSLLVETAQADCPRCDDVGRARGADVAICIERDNLSLPCGLAVYCGIPAGGRLRT